MSISQFHEGSTITALSTNTVCAVCTKSQNIRFPQDLRGFGEEGTCPGLTLEECDGKNCSLIDCPLLTQCATFFHLTLICVLI